MTQLPRKTVFQAMLKYTFFYKKNFHKKMSLRNPKTLRNCQENLKSQTSELQISKNDGFFLSSLKVTKLNKFFANLKFFSVIIIKKMTFIVCVKPI